MKPLYLLFIYYTVWCLAEEKILHRFKRKVLFSKNSKMFFRLNGKDNVIPWTQIFAHGWAIRLNWDLPESLPKRHKFFKRDVHPDIKSIDDYTGSYSCILSYLCDFISNIQISSKCGIFCEIGKIMASSRGTDSDFFRDIFASCHHRNTECPYIFKSQQLH